MSGTDVWMHVIDEIGQRLPSLGKTLSYFYDGRYGFQSHPRADEASIINHSRGIEASLVLPAASGATFTELRARQQQLDVLVKNPWTTSDEKEPSSYPVSVALPALTVLKTEEGLGVDQYSDLVKKAATELIAEANRFLATRSVTDVRQLPRFRHGMFLFRLRRALAILDSHWSAQLASLNEDGQLTSAIQALDDYLRDRLYYFLSMCAAIPNDDEDALQLGYIIFALYEYRGYDNDVVIEHALDLVLQPLFGEGQVPRVQTVLQDGSLNISASPIEVMGLLARLPHVKRRFARYAEFYARGYQWLRTTQKTETVDGVDVPLWMAEPWRGSGKAETWVNACVIEFYAIYQKLLRDVCCTLLLTELRAVSTRPRVMWDHIVDYGGFKGQLKAGFLEPGLEAIRSGTKLHKTSLILFGPPGTAKTSIARSIAWHLGWPFLQIRPHDFAEEGTDGVIRRAREIFKKLMILRHCVVLLDEIDELVSAREEEGEKIGRFITTSVLPWFQELRDRAEIVFIVATNSVRRFDAAVKRPGRFDFVVPIGPPDSDAREKKLVEFLKENDIDDEDQAAKLAALVNKHIESAEVKTREEGVTGVDGAEGDADRSWHATIGELRYIAEHIGANPSSRSSEAIKQLVEIGAKKPLINPADWAEFARDARDYRWPPTLGS